MNNMFQSYPQGTPGIMQGSTLYVFNRKDLTSFPVSVVAVSAPHLTKSAQNNPAAILQGMVVDLTLSTGDETIQLEFPVNATNANYPDKGWYVSTDEAAVDREIAAMGNMAKQALSQMPLQKKIADGCDALMMKRHPDKQREAEQAQMISLLQAQVQDLQRRSTGTDEKLDRILAAISAGSGGTQEKQD